MATTKLTSMTSKRSTFISNININLNLKNNSNTNIKDKINANNNNNNNNNNNSINYLLPRMGSIGSKPIAAKTPRRRLDRFSVTCIVKMGPGGG